MSRTESSPIARGIGFASLAALCLAGAALAAFVAWFFISDMIGDWYEVNSPEIPRPGQQIPSYWTERGHLKTALGVTVWFSPFFVLLFFALRFFSRAFIPINQPALDAPPSKKDAQQAAP